MQHHIGNFLPNILSSSAAGLQHCKTMIGAIKFVKHSVGHLVDHNGQTTRRHEVVPGAGAKESGGGYVREMAVPWGSWSSWRV